MMTPQEVASHSFAKATLGGYNLAQVDEFLDALTEDYAALYNENAILKNKLKVLSDTVEEYRATDNAMRKTLLAAQKMADDMVADAKKKQAELVGEAEQDAHKRVEELQKAVKAEEFRLKKAQQETAAYVDKVRALHAKEAEYLSQLEELVPPDTTPAPDPVEEKAAEIDDNVQRLLAQAMEAAAAENLRARAEEEDDDERDMSDTVLYSPDIQTQWRLSEKKTLLLGALR